MQRKVNVPEEIEMEKWIGNMGSSGGGCEVFMCDFYSEQNFYAVCVEQNALCEEGNNLLTRKNKA